MALKGSQLGCRAQTSWLPTTKGQPLSPGHPNGHFLQDSLSRSPAWHSEVKQGQGGLLLKKNASV